MNELKIALVSCNKGVEPPIGLVTLATYLKEKENFNNINMVDINFDKVFAKVMELNPNIICFSSFTMYYALTIDMAKKIKENLNAPIVLGGTHISTLPQSLEKCFDIAVIGEGEITLSELLKLYGKKRKFEVKDLKQIKGITFFDDDNKLVINERREPIKNLDEIPNLDKSFINKNYFKKTILPNGKYGRLANMVTARGCPYRCSFCSTSVFWGNTVRYHSPEYITKEIEDYVKNYKVKHIIIWDDLFTINLDRLKKFSKLLNEKKLKLSFTCEVRADLVTEELCKILKELNVERVGFGFESGSERILKMLKKESVTIEDNKRAVDLCKKYNFLVEGSLIFASPSEKIEDMKKSIELIRSMIKKKVNNIWTYILTPLPGTEMWEIAKQRGRVKDSNMDWRILFFQNINNPLLLDEDIDKEEFKKLMGDLRIELQYFRRKKIKKDMINHPLQLIKKTIKNPHFGFRILTRKPIDENLWAIKKEDLS